MVKARFYRDDKGNKDTSNTSTAPSSHPSPQAEEFRFS
jgi:hypothetical protein